MKVWRGFPSFPYVSCQCLIVCGLGEPASYHPLSTASFPPYKILAQPLSPLDASQAPCFLNSKKPCRFRWGCVKLQPLTSTFSFYRQFQQVEILWKILLRETAFFKPPVIRYCGMCFNCRSELKSGSVFPWVILSEVESYDFRNSVLLLEVA